MLALNLTPLLKARGRTRFWLYKQLGMSYTNFRRMMDGETQSIRFDTLGKLCEVLDCHPSELFNVPFTGFKSYHYTASGRAELGPLDASSPIWNKSRL